MTRNIDHKLQIVPLNYLRKGDYFVATNARPEKFVNTQLTVASGIADMDGHEVSDNYGFRAGNSYYHNNPSKDYLNVRFNGVEYGHDHKRVNDSLYLDDGWTVYVTRDVADRIALDVRHNQDWPAHQEAARLATQKAELLAQVAVLQQKIKELS